MRGLSWPCGLFLVALASSGGCQVGPDVRSMRPATTPQGTHAELRLVTQGEPTLEGELIAVRVDDLLLETTRGLTSVPYDMFDQASFEDAPGVGRWRDRSSQRDALARFSRYPFGISDELVDRLLEARDQPELFVIRR